MISRTRLDEIRGIFEANDFQLDCAECDELFAEVERGLSACQWTADENGLFDTGCGHAFVTEAGSLEECEFKFCIYCGKPIQEIPWVDPWAEEEAS